MSAGKGRKGSLARDALLGTRYRPAEAQFKVQHGFELPDASTLIRVQNVRFGPRLASVTYQPFQGWRLPGAIR